MEYINIPALHRRTHSCCDHGTMAHLTIWPVNTAMGYGPTNSYIYELITIYIYYIGVCSFRWAITLPLTVINISWNLPFVMVKSMRIPASFWRVKCLGAWRKTALAWRAWRGRSSKQIVTIPDVPKPTHPKYVCVCVCVFYILRTNDIW